MNWTIVEKIIETPITVTLRFRPEHPVDFKPGQFFMLAGTIEGKPVKRAYSLSSPPTRPLTDVTVKLGTNPYFSKLLHGLQVGDFLDVTGPFGHFVYDETMSKDLVFIGAGSGIAPLMAIAKYVRDKKLDVRMTMIYSSKTRDLIIFREELDALSRDHIMPLHLALTQEQHLGTHHGRISKDLLTHAIPDFTKPLFYLCGPPEMVNGTARMLLDLGAKKEQIKTERFN